MKPLPDWYWYNRYFYQHFADGAGPILEEALASRGKGFLSGNGFGLYPERVIFLEKIEPRRVGDPLWND